VRGLHKSEKIRNCLRQFRADVGIRPYESCSQETMPTSSRWMHCRGEPSAIKTDCHVALLLAMTRELRYSCHCEEGVSPTWQSICSRFCNVLRRKSKTIPIFCLSSRRYSRCCIDRILPKLSHDEKEFLCFPVPICCIAVGSCPTIVRYLFD